MDEKNKKGKVLPVNIDDRVLIISIGVTYREGMDDKALYEATRSSWKVSERKEKADYALAVYRGEVKEVYKILNWHKDDENIERWVFTGELAPKNIRDKYIGRSVKQYRKWGNINPIIYVNC